MKFFEQELKKICDKSEVLSNQKYLGSSCIATIDDCKLAKICFNTNGFAGQFGHLDITIINKNGGTIDNTTLKLSEYLGSADEQYGYAPAQIRVLNNEYCWYRIKPTPEQFKDLCDDIDNYTVMFQQQSQAHNLSM